METAPAHIYTHRVAVLIRSIDGVSCVEQLLTCRAWLMLAEATVAVLVVPVSCVSQGGLEQTSVTAASSASQ